MMTITTRSQRGHGWPVVDAVDWRLEGEYPHENPNDVLMSELENQFRYNNERAINKIRNFTALPGETTSQCQSRLALLIAENPIMVHTEMAIRLFLESYPQRQHKANWGSLRC